MDRAHRGIGITDNGWTAFSGHWRGPARDSKAKAAIDLRARLKAECSTVTGRIKGRIGDLVAAVGEVVGDG
jgi:hypothetical protein